MTEKYFFDTDCLSAFLWIRGESILGKLYPGEIVLPAQVYDELKRVPHLLDRVNAMKDASLLEIGQITTGTAEYEAYMKMTVSPAHGLRLIGKGEAAAIAMTSCRGGVLASNNLNDVAAYVRQLGLEHITTGDILQRALKENIISEDEGNVIWAEMIQKRRMLPTKTFSEFLRENR